MKPQTLHPAPYTLNSRPCSQNKAGIETVTRTEDVEGAVKSQDGQVASPSCEETEFFIDNLLVRIRFIIEMIWWTGLAPWALEYLFRGSLRILREASRGDPRRSRVVSTSSLESTSIA